MIAFFTFSLQIQNSNVSYDWPGAIWTRREREKLQKGTKLQWAEGTPVLETKWNRLSEI